MRQIQRIEVKNFKSLVDFKIELSKFSCLIGLNGAGKSTVLQFVDFLSQLVRGDMEGWLSERKWRARDLKSKLTKKVNIEFIVHFSDENGEGVGQWEATYNPLKKQCTWEHIDLLDSELESDKRTVSLRAISNGAGRSYEIAFDYQGSILSALKDELLSPSLRDCKTFFQEIKSLELLAPDYLRQRTRESSGTLGLGGQNLSAFLHEMSEERRQRLIASLTKAYPSFQSLQVKSLRSGWKQLEISEGYEGPEKSLFPSLSSMTTEARHINDGMLRLIAILAELQSDNRFVLFDEIENGINPELVGFVIEMLVSTPKKQVLVTTHSPMILNYLEDEIARRGVIYLYKTRQGRTEAIPFFSIPSLAKKLTVMGPGEAFVDTNLTLLHKEIEQTAGER
jgi:ABC-type branched-subunit amino acid transport system ATPase component